jgi:hypothetical protein
MSPTDPPATTAWLRILQLGSDAWLGLVGEELFVGSYETPKRRVDPANPTGLLPCLEKPRDIVIAELRAREVDLCVAQGTLTELVPLDAIPAAAVASEMDYWVQLALDWLAEVPGGDASDGLLGTIAHSTWATQRARHRATNLRRVR